MSDLGKIRARRAAIGEADWQAEESRRPEFSHILLLDPHMPAIANDNDPIFLYGDLREQLAEFIAHAPADIDTLLSEVERLQATLDERRELEPKTVQCEFCEMEILATNVVRIGSHHHALCAGCAATYRTQETKDDESPF
jgi:hypothetical protein